MTRTSQHPAPEEVAGGYGTPTVEQETPAQMPSNSPSPARRRISMPWA